MGVETTISSGWTSKTKVVKELDFVIEVPVKCDNDIHCDALGNLM